MHKSSWTAFAKVPGFDVSPWTELERGAAAGRGEYPPDLIRDPEVVLDWLRRAEVGDTAVRNALVVTLGLLGSPAPMELAWPRPGDPEGATAYLASVALGVDGQEERMDLADAAQLRAHGAAVEVAERALERIEAGGRLSVVD